MAGLDLSLLTLSHFRSHKTLRLELDARPVAIHGPNGAGKTNILEAVSLLSPGRGLRRAAADEIARRPEALGWKVSGILRALHQTHEVETQAEPGAGRSVRIDGKAAAQVALGRIARIVWLVPAMDRLWLEGASERRRFLDRIALSFEPGHADRSLAYEKAMRERNRLLKDNVRDEAWLTALEAQMAKAGAGIARARAGAVARLTDAQEAAESAFPKAGIAAEGETEARFAAAIAEGRDAREEEDAAEAALSEGWAANRAADYAAGRTLEGPHRSDLQATFVAKGVEARLCSTGEQKALLISLILANARALAAEEDGETPVILLDEVAAHLDEGRRAALYDEICALGAQAWMTGTDASLFENLGDRAQLFNVAHGEITPQA